MIIRIPVCRSSRVIVIKELTRGVPSERYYQRHEAVKVDQGDQQLQTYLMRFVNNQDLPRIEFSALEEPCDDLE